MNTRTLLAFGLIALLGAACGGSKSTTPAAATTKTFACNFATGGLCFSLAGIPSATDLTPSNSQCTSGGGAVVAACPAASRVGCCAMPKSTPTEPQQTFCYYDPTFDATSGRADCIADPPGTWTPG